MIKARIGDVVTVQCRGDSRVVLLNGRELTTLPCTDFRIAYEIVRDITPRGCCPRNVPSSSSGISFRIGLR